MGFLSASDDFVRWAAAGAYQPDEDDYGYESKTATDMYSKLLQQYEKMPDKEYLKQKKKKDLADRSLDLAATKVSYTRIHLAMSGYVSCSGVGVCVCYSCCIT